MPSTTTARGEMIEMLVEHSVNVAVAESPKHWLKKVFENGFIGYGKLSDRQLLMEMHLRGLILPEDGIDDEADGQEDDYQPNQMFN